MINRYYIKATTQDRISSLFSFIDYHQHRKKASRRLLAKPTPFFTADRNGFPLPFVFVRQWPAPFFIFSPLALLCLPTALVKVSFALLIFSPCRRWTTERFVESRCGQFPYINYLYLEDLIQLITYCFQILSIDCWLFCLFHLQLYFHLISVSQ